MQFKKSLALSLGALVLGFTALAWAGEEVPTTRPAVEVKVADAAAKPSTPTPVHSILKWVGSHVMDGECACPSTEKGAAGWRAWFTAKDAPLANLRDALVRDGWGADRTIGFFQKMGTAKAGCSDCSDSSDCQGCDKASSKTAKVLTGVTADAPAAKASGCNGCSKSKGAQVPTAVASERKAGSGCNGCSKSKGTQVPTAVASERKAGSGCNGCSKSKGTQVPTAVASERKAGSGCNGCSKSKGTQVPTAVASERKAASGCNGCSKSKGMQVPTAVASERKAASGCNGCSKSKGAQVPTAVASERKAASGCNGCSKSKAAGTPSPVHSILKWVGSHVMDGDCACPSTDKGATAWRAWFAAKDAPLAGLRNALVKDGWTANRTIDFFKMMSAKMAPSSGDATGAVDATEAPTSSTKCKCTGKDRADCEGCDKAACPCNKGK